MAFQKQRYKKWRSGSYLSLWETSNARCLRPHHRSPALSESDTTKCMCSQFNSYLWVYLKITYPYAQIFDVHWVTRRRLWPDGREGHQTVLGLKPLHSSKNNKQKFSRLFCCCCFFSVSKRKKNQMGEPAKKRNKVDETEPQPLPALDSLDLKQMRKIFYSAYFLLSSTLYFSLTLFFQVASSLQRRCTICL